MLRRGKARRVERVAETKIRAIAEHLTIGNIHNRVPGEILIARERARLEKHLAIGRGVFTTHQTLARRKYFPVLPVDAEPFQNLRRVWQRFNRRALIEILEVRAPSRQKPRSL